MADLSNIPNAFSHTLFHNYEVINLRILFAQAFDIQTTDYDLLNKFVIHRFNQYNAVNTEDYSLWDCIQIDFEKWESKYFNKLDNAIWKIFRDYYYHHEYWINYNIAPSKTYTIVMLKIFETDWNSKWTIE